MEPSTTNTTTAPAAGASKRRRKAAQPLGDLTNLLPSTPAPRNPSAKRPLRPPRSDASACSWSASATPVSKASSAAAVEEPGLVKSPISTIYTSRETRRRRNPTSVKAPFPTGAAASCPPLGRATRASRRRSTWGWKTHLLVDPSYQMISSRSREHTSRRSTPLNCQRKRPQKLTDRHRKIKPIRGSCTIQLYKDLLARVTFMG
ncbi:uncharacterized protein LOC123448049 isoform X1 [Hordeum vulgare subsp. vulgare]|uniref:uncharacterized protein LOC123448049 isoform X1 n=1 Tax=Hordeum vulgare subsp. vulgare TaxID=112509 RepID=UPI001D1A5432|nr:uncharacterized protein LOC123448049 isoform X1 [Hordeum vulgare subsp. vulgare]